MMLNRHLARCGGDDSKRRHGNDDETGAITSTPISKRKRTDTVGGGGDDVTMCDSKTPSSQDKSDDDVGKSANMSPSTSSTSSSFDEGNSIDISQTGSNSSASVSPFRHSLNEDEDKMRAGSPDSGIEATASPYSASDSFMYNFPMSNKKKERLSSSSQEVMSNADSCVPLDSTPTSPEDNTADSNKESASDSEQRKTSESVESPPVSTYRLCLERPPEPPKPKPAEPSVVCHWDDCEEIFFEGSQLQDHLQEQHVKSATDESKYACRWRGCRVYNKPTRNSSCLHQHVLSHSGCKRFPCCFEGCSARFQTSAGLERHVSSHLKKEKSIERSKLKSTNQHSAYGGGRPNNGGGGPLGVRRRYKDQMMPLANRYDCMDAYTMEKISYRLRLLKRFEEKKATRRRHIPTTSSSSSTPSSMTSQSPITTTMSSSLDCSASSVATASSSSSPSEQATSSHHQEQEEEQGGKSSASAICELFGRSTSAAPSRTELEDILFFNRPQKRRRKNKREVYGPQLFGGPNY